MEDDFEFVCPVCELLEGEQDNGTKIGVDGDCEGEIRRQD
jgi:hypothetical protein